MIILPQKPLQHLLLPLLVLHPLVILPQQPLKMFRPFLSVDGTAHLLRYLRMKVIADNRLPRLVGNLIADYVV